MCAWPPWIILLMTYMLSTTSFIRLAQNQGQVGSLSRRYLNRVLLEANELQPLPNGHFSAHLPADDNRTKHIKTILHLSDGDTIKCGVLNKGITDHGHVSCNTNHSINVHIGDLDKLQPTPKPRIILLLAIPRPLRLERILPVISCLGVEKLVLLGAGKVEKDYFGSHLLRRPEAMRALLVEGLSQAAVDCNVPVVTVSKNLRHFIDTELDSIVPAHDSHRYLKLIAHPPMANIPHIQAHELFASVGERHARVVVCIGPEGGWESEEVEMFTSKGFLVTSLGKRILRTDIAVPVLLGLVNEYLASIEQR
jgi:16S rRNA (uracil1498-N3)-methyltransferase